MIHSHWLSFFALLGVSLSAIAAPSPPRIPALLSVQESDAILQAAAREGKLAPLSAPAPQPEALVRLGRSLFFEPLLSGNRDITCAACHHPRAFTNDGLPVSIGAGGRGVGPQRQQGTGQLLRRNAPALYNLGLANDIRMFWDARVMYSERSKSFITPEPALNDYFPMTPDKRHPIARALDSSLAAQALFPLVTHEEMRGPRGSNEIADAPNNLEAWSRILARVRDSKHYPGLLSEAFPEIAPAELNIGHLATAIAAFERQAFLAIDTPLDRYLRGERDALTPLQKQGAAVFATRARCIQCHNGPQLTRFDIFTIGVPQVGPATASGLPADDLGRYDIETVAWLKDTWRYGFRVPPLRNIALTAPYMHNGAFATLREVLQHYSDPAASVAQTTPLETPQGFRDRLVSDRGSDRARARLKSLDPRLRDPIRLSDAETNALVEFLEHGLTDPAYVGPTSTLR